MGHNSQLWFQDQKIPTTGLNQAKSEGSAKAIEKDPGTQT